MTEFCAQFSDPATGFSVVIDDDGEKASAYLLDSEASVVGDVWLYNHAHAPASPDWTDPPICPLPTLPSHER